MTFRARPASSRTRTLDDRDRRNMYLNIGFGIIVVAALGLLALAVGMSWYDEHLAPAATINGEGISKDAYRTRLAIDLFRSDYQERRIRSLLNAGQLRVADAQARLSLIDQRKQQAATLALEHLIDARIQSDLAPGQGVSVTDADVDAKFTDEATRSELRHGWLIAVEPELAPGEASPSDEAKAAARQKAEAALADLRAGSDWETVARDVSTDPTKDQGGDLGWVDAYAAIDQAFDEALFTAELNAPTEVVEGEDGVFRIGRATEIAPPVVDPTLEQQVLGDGISMADFRDVLRADVVRQRLEDEIVADATAPGPQRRVAEIYMQGGTAPADDAIKTRHILYSPNDDPQGAADLDPADPAWKEAEDAARATYEKLKADPTQFDAIARAESDEGSAVTSGGKLPYFAPGDQIDQDFANAIFAPGLRDGQLLEPVRSQFGWHVIQIMHRPTDLQWAQKLKDQLDAGADFASLARDNSDGAEAVDGGDLGWVVRGLLPETVGAPLFAAPVGEVADPIEIPGDGVYLWKVLEEQVRDPDPDQRLQLERTSFSNWYTAQKGTYTITRDTATTAGA
jgi:parvulin-like peptidyl-prolyl isomerase